MVEDRRTFEPTESREEAERLFIEDFDAWDMTGYYLYSKLLRSGVSRHIGTGGAMAAVLEGRAHDLELLLAPAHPDAEAHTTVR